MTTLFKTFLIAILFSSTAAWAQSTLTGVVINSKTNEPLVGAHVQLSLSGKIALTNDQGRYTFINVLPGNYTLEVTYIGYTSLVKEITVGSEKMKAVNIPM